LSIVFVESFLVPLTMSFLWGSKKDMKTKKFETKESKDKEASDGSDSEASTVASESEVRITTVYGLVQDHATKKPCKASAEEKPSTKPVALVSKAEPQAPNEVFIDGKLYNVDKFKHPGGSIIKFFQGSGDASAAFLQFHIRSKKAQKMLNGLPSRAASPEIVEKATGGKQELQKDFEKLTLDLKAQGYFEPNMTEVIFRHSEIAVIFAIGFYLLLWTTSWPLRAVGIVFLGIAEGRCGWLMHEGGHLSLTGNIKRDQFLQIWLYGVGCGMSAGWWRSQHNRHHATPQKVGADPDLDTLPLVLFNTAVTARGVPKMMKRWLQAQAFLFIPLSCLLVVLGWQLYLHPRYVLRTSKWMELASLVFRYFVTFTFVFKGFSWPAAIGCYVLIQQVAGSYIFTNFALSHTHTDVTASDQHIHWCEYASDHTVNLSNHWFVNWWMAYLNFQIEHHMFPSMPQFRHPAVSKRVRNLFRKHGLRYDTRGYFSCLADTLKNLHEVGNTVEVKTSKKQQ